MHLKVAIMTVTYNRLEYCQKALEALKKYQDDKIEFSFFVLDNGSSDATPQYLRKLQSQDRRFHIFLKNENYGTAKGYQLLLDAIFDQEFDFIIKNDDDEFFPPNWTNLLDYWIPITRAGVLMAGFKRRCTDDYFRGLGWVSRNPQNLNPVYFGENECYFSYIVVGPQISTKYGWKLLYPYLSDYGEKFGGWDVSIAKRIQSLKKKCLVVYNKPCIHFQRWEDHPEYSQEKFQQIERVRQKLS